MILKLLEGNFSICKYPPNTEVPVWVFQSGVFFLAKTDDELSIICESGFVPADVSDNGEWRCFRVHGDLEFEQIGVVATVASPVADAGISLFLVSTHDRDYVLVHTESLEQVIQVYQQRGFKVIRGSEKQ